MKAVRPIGDGVEVIDVDEPPGAGELLQVKSASICHSDFAYIGMGTREILGHEVAGFRADGTPVVVEAMYGCTELMVEP
jgi:threonine dehydrogenase-like Zn-dependent dehydrogenase